jgi:hypothetical protein
MYNAHRGLVPQPNNRLTELLDQVRAEFDNQTGRAGEYEHQSESSLVFIRYRFVASSSKPSFTLHDLKRGLTSDGVNVVS